MRRKQPRITLVLLLFSLTTHADDADFVGKWLVEIKVPAAPLIGHLDIEATREGLIAFVDGGPAPISVDGVNVEIMIDSRDRQGFRFQRRLTGELDKGAMSGSMQSIDVLETAAEFGEDGSSWTAVRYVNTPPVEPIKSAADVAGIWVPLRGVDIRKWTMALTPEAKAWHADYDARMDEPQKRCISPGLVAAITWSFPFEIAASGENLVMLYEAFNLSRRVFLDGRPEPEFFPNSSMGYSTAAIEDGELVVKTSLLTNTTRDFNGEPISENASTIERYRLSDDGNRLAMELTLLDAANYERAPVRRRVWTRNDEAVIYPFECDPDSFFRQLFNEGRMQDYIDRSPRRQ